MDPAQFAELKGLIEETTKKAVEAMKTDNAEIRQKCEGLALDLGRMKAVFTRMDTLLGKMSELGRLMAAQEAAGKEQGAKIIELKDSIKKEISDMNAQIKALPLTKQTQRREEDALSLVRTFGRIDG